jgi:hypothetical protein
MITFLLSIQRFVNHFTISGKKRSLEFSILSMIWSQFSNLQHSNKKVDYWKYYQELKLLLTFSNSKRYSFKLLSLFDELPFYRENKEGNDRIFILYRIENYLSFYENSHPHLRKSMLNFFIHNFWNIWGKLYCPIIMKSFYYLKFCVNDDFKCIEKF